MRSQIVAGLFLLSSCGTVKKVITKQDVKTDSISVSVRDTTTKVVEEKDQRDFDLKDLDITIEYDSSVITTPIKHFSQPEIQTLHNVIESVSSRYPSKVIIHVGSLSDSGSKIATTVIVSGHEKDSSHLKKEVATTNKNVIRKTIPIWLIIGGSLVALVFIAIGAIKLYKRFIP